MFEKFVHVRGDDWEGLYVNGELVFEDQVIGAQMMSKVKSEYAENAEPVVKYCDQFWLEGMGRNLPERIDDVWWDH